MEQALGIQDDCIRRRATHSTYMVFVYYEGKVTSKCVSALSSEVRGLISSIWDELRRVIG